jgi:hypothetical protein
MVRFFFFCFLWTLSLSSNENNHDVFSIKSHPIIISKKKFSLSSSLKENFFEDPLIKIKTTSSSAPCKETSFRKKKTENNTLMAINPTYTTSTNEDFDHDLKEALLAPCLTRLDTLEKEIEGLKKEVESQKLLIKQQQEAMDELKEEQNILMSLRPQTHTSQVPPLFHRQFPITGRLIVSVCIGIGCFLYTNDPYHLIYIPGYYLILYRTLPSLYTQDRL